MSRRDQSQHATRARENALAHRSLTANLITDDLPSRSPRDPALEHEGYSEGLPPDLRSFTQSRQEDFLAPLRFPLRLCVKYSYKLSKVRRTRSVSERSGSRASGWQARISASEKVRPVPTATARAPK